MLPFSSFTHEMRCKTALAEMVIGFCSVRLLHIPVLSMGPEVRVDGWRWQ